MPSQLFVLPGSKNFTSDRAVRISPGCPYWSRWCRVRHKMPCLTCVNQRRASAVLPAPYCPYSVAKDQQKTDGVVDPLLFHAWTFSRERLPWSRCFVHSNSRGRVVCACSARVWGRPSVKRTSSDLLDPRSTARGLRGSFVAVSWPGQARQVTTLSHNPWLWIQLRAF
jgi:hypothetical protein